MVPSDVGASDYQAKIALRFIDDGCTVEVAILWHSCVQTYTNVSLKSSVTAMYAKLRKRGVNLEYAKVVGFEQGLSAVHLSTFHGMESKGLIPLGFACMTDFTKENPRWATCCSMAFYIQSQSHTQETELHFESGEFYSSSKSDTEGNSSRSQC